MPSLGLVCNLYNEANALPGWLETHLPYFDDVRVYHSGPGGELSNDGTMEILEKWHIPVLIGSIDDGFGAVRTRAVRSSPCDWAMLLDVDERFYPILPVLVCEGESTPPEDADALLYDYGNPNFEKDGPKSQILQRYDNPLGFNACPSNFENMRLLGANLRVKTQFEPFNQGEALRHLIAQDGIDAVKTIRRHWHDFSWKRPTQNWHTDPDYQARIVRNNGKIEWEQSTRMHEKLTGAEIVSTPNHTHGPFFEHFHLFFKRLEVEQRGHDIAIYNAVGEGKRPPTREEWRQQLTSK